MTVPELIEATGLSNAQIAVRLEVDANSVYRWRAGMIVPHRGFRRRLTALAKLTPADVTWTIEKKLETDRECT